MDIISLLILFPLMSAIVIFLVRNDDARNVIVRICALITAALTMIFLFRYFNEQYFLAVGYRETVNYVILALEAIIAVYLLIVSIKNKKYLVTLFALIQTPLIFWFEFTHMHEMRFFSDFVIDKLSIIMVFIIGIVGSLICLYAVGYMKWYHIHHSEYKERKSFFFSILFLFLSAMFGLVLSNSLMWIYFCWEVTSLCSFLLIGYTKTEKAKKNSFLALKINLGGGLAFAIAIVLAGINLHTIELSVLVSLKPGVIVLASVFLLCIAALTKSAQLPFSSWLLGAMVAPTPSSALLHSATMVKAGVYLIIRLAPLLGETSVGRIITLCGSITFILTSCIAISQKDAKKILAYSTIANLGLIVICASVGTQESLWAAILLVIFHSVSKSLLFLSVGSAEHQLGSRDVEDMDVLSGVSSKLSIYMIIGIAGMFLAPFGMLISKWIAMKAFIDSKNILTVIILAYGSAATLFYWTKWMGKLVSNANHKNIRKHTFHLDEEVPIFLQAVLVALSCFTFPLISKYALVPYLSEVFKSYSDMPISVNDVYIMLVMLSMIIILPVSFNTIFFRNDKRRTVPVYMAGQNAGDNENFIDSFGEKRKMELSNWYMEGYFGSKKLTFWGNIVSVVVLFSGVILLIGGYIV